MHKTEPALKKCVWREVRDEVIKVNPDLAREIDLLDPSDDYALYTLEVPWGQHLLKDGRLCLPNAEGRFVSIEDPSIDNSIREDLNYNISIAFGMVLNNSVEFYYNSIGRLIPMIFMQPGSLFALWLSLQDVATHDHSGATSNIVAGTRFIHFLPNIYDSANFKKIQKELNLKVDMPHDFVSQWDALKAIANHSYFPIKWNAKVMYFSERWIQTMAERKDAKWRLFREHVLDIAWKATNHFRNSPVWDLAFSQAIHNKNLKPNPYLFDTVKHLYHIGNKSSYGYVFASDNVVAPISGFQKIFEDIYGLRYAPLMMHSGYLINDAFKPVYYSLEVPTLYSFSPKSRQTNTKLTELRDISRIIDKIKLFFAEDKLHLGECPLFHLVKNLRFDYIHAGKIEEDSTILHTKNLVNYDDRLRMQLEQHPKPFSEANSFFNGCIKISSN